MPTKCWCGEHRADGGLMNIFLKGAFYMQQSMGFSSTTVSRVTLLTRQPFEAIALTLDASAFGENGVCKAGTPIAADGTISNTAAVRGILLHDVAKEYPQAQLLTKGYVSKLKAQANSGVELSAETKAALPMIIWE